MESFRGWAGDEDKYRSDEWFALILLLLVVYVAFKSGERVRSEGNNVRQSSPINTPDRSPPPAPIIDIDGDEAPSPERGTEARNRAREASLRRQKEAKANLRKKKFAGASSSTSPTSRSAKNFGGGATLGGAAGGAVGGPPQPL